MINDVQGLREVTGSYVRTKTERGITATRVFVFDESDINHTASLPEVGDIFENPLTADEEPMDGLICRSVEETAVNSDQRVIQFTVQYSNEPCDITQFIPDEENPMPDDATNLPISMEYSCEFVNIRPATEADSQWQWTDSGDSVLDPISFRVTNLTMRVKRWISDTYYNIFMDNCRVMQGTVNIAEMPVGPAGGIGCWLFTNVTTEMFRNHKDQKIWQAELIFVYRDPDGTNVNGWNKILRNDGTWQVPKRKGISPDQNMYNTTNFTWLFGNEVYEE